MKKHILSFALLLAMIMSLALPCYADTYPQVQCSWTADAVEHEGFRDLGNYVICLPDFDDASIQDEAREIVNEGLDHGDISVFGCTAMIKRNSEGEVVAGRNMDLFISEKPAYVFTTSYGKYKTFCVTYSPSSGPTYAEAQDLDRLDDGWQKKLVYIASDCLNEKGLYIEQNMRTAYPALSNYGLHSARGETVRDDGTPWSELRACTLTVPQLVSQNCATVEEAVEFLNNSFDWYTTGMPYNPEYDGWNYAFIVGDATGEYGLIEIAQDEVNYIPYQFGQANFYITPKWSALDTSGGGYGRLEGISGVIGDVDSAEDAMDAMKAVFWKNTTLWIGESERIEDGTRPNPYNQIVFRDSDGNRTLDWRNEYYEQGPVLDDGRAVIKAETYQRAVESTYDRNILKYYDDAIERGTLVVDDGSILFDVGSEQLTISELGDRYMLYKECWDMPEEQEKLRPYYEIVDHLMKNMGVRWCLDDHNFEAEKAIVYDYLHTRFNADGEPDPSCTSKYEKLLAFYGIGTEKDESALRAEASVWTSSLNIGTNCARKEMKIRFWENDDIVLGFKF